MAAKRTGAQQEEVMPEKMPKTKTETTFTFSGNLYEGRKGKAILVSKKVIIPKITINKAPKR